MNRRTLLAALAATLAATLGWAAPAWAAEPPKVGFIYVGPVGDAGWIYAHDQGRLALEKACMPSAGIPTCCVSRRKRT
jgi:basic membrane protein A